MNTILRSSVRSIRSLTSFTSIAKSIQNRTIYHMVNRQSFASNTAIQLANPSISCKCGCAGMSKIHTKGKLRKSSLNLLNEMFEVIRLKFHDFLWMLQENVSWLNSSPTKSLPKKRHQRKRRSQLQLMDSKSSWMDLKLSSLKALEAKRKKKIN